MPRLPGLRDDLRILLIDEKAVRKRHGYVTLVMNGLTGELPGADIVFDKFHLIANYHAVIDEVRRSEWRKAAVSGVEVLRKFGRSLLRSKTEVLNYCKHRITTGRLEGFNNLVSRIVHRARGMQDLDYLFLKLRQESLDFVPQS